LTIDEACPKRPKFDLQTFDFDRFSSFSASLFPILRDNNNNDDF
jgi:hypothetical protein